MFLTVQFLSEAFCEGSAEHHASGGGKLKVSPTVRPSPEATPDASMSRLVTCKVEGSFPINPEKLGVPQAWSGAEEAELPIVGAAVGGSRGDLRGLQ